MFGLHSINLLYAIEMTQSRKKNVRVMNEFSTSYSVLVSYVKLFDSSLKCPIFKSRGMDQKRDLFT